MHREKPHAEFYDQNFPEGRHKLSKSDLEVVRVILEDSYSDDVLMAVYISTLRAEGSNPTFEHPVGWDSLSDIEKAHLVVETVFLKCIAVVDYNDMSFKDASSLFEKVTEFLSQESRLECNKPKITRFVDQVQAEIRETRAKIDFYQNQKKDDFPENTDRFKFLGIMTNPNNDMMRLRGKGSEFQK